MKVLFLGTIRFGSDEAQLFEAQNHNSSYIWLWGRDVLVSLMSLMSPPNRAMGLEHLKAMHVPHFGMLTFTSKWQGESEAIPNSSNSSHAT